MGRCVFIYPNVQGGVKTYISNLSDYLKKKGIEHKVIAYEPGDSLFHKKNAGPENNIQLIFSRYSTRYSKYKFLKKEVDSNDTLICNDSFELEAISELGILNKTIYILHGDLHHYQKTLENNLSVIDLVLCVSNGLKKKYRQLFPGMVFGVSHPLIENFKKEIKPAAGDQLTGIFIGRFEHAKGGDTFNEVVNACIEKKIPVQWKAFIPKKGNEDELVAAIPAPVKIEVDKPNKDVLQALETVDFLLFPSRSEGFGIVVLEAMKQGVVPIARDLPIGIPDMIVNGESGWLANEKDDILTIIDRLSKDAQLLQKMKIQAMSFSNSIFDYDKTGERFIENINDLLQPLAGNKKKFPDTSKRLTETMLPEYVFRILKYFHNRIKYGQ